jgi:hypothetical protein
MRYVVLIFYAAVVSFAGWAGGPGAAASVLFAAVALLIMLRPADAARAISDWAGWFFRRGEVRSSS